MTHLCATAADFSRCAALVDTMAIEIMSAFGALVLVFCLWWGRERT